MNINILIWLIPLPPLLSFFVIMLFTNPRKALSHYIAVGAAGLSWLLGMIVFFFAIFTKGLAEHPFGSAINWLPIGGDGAAFHPFQIGVRIDPLSAVVLFFVVWTVLMIFIYSIGYHNYGQPKGEHDVPGLPPHGATIRNKKAKGSIHVPSIEPMYSRFFALISLFAFAMLVLVISDNFLTLYIGWEIMGFCSYALIGFWYAKPSARDAAVKAFMTTRIGDVFMLLGLVALYTQIGTLKYSDILAQQSALTAPSVIPGLTWAWLIGILLFIGVVGKSAQFPLHVWLPDAMEGPTPVSAMIHAATMVSAGVYLALRIFPLATMGWAPGEPITPAMTTMAAIGAFTALFAATIAVAQNDIKRVLAYSTISQLGYMIAALGVGAYTAAAFHLFTHAFFKALLFLGSGSVIHGMEHGLLHTGNHETDPQDMRNMGGLREKMPVTFWTFTIGGLALSGLPLVTAGFWSKDEILAGAFNSGHQVVFWVLALSALLTAFYTARQITLTFLGKPRTAEAEHAHETGRTMTIPLIILSVFAMAAGWFGIPHTFPGLGQVIPNLFEGFVGSMLPGEGGAAEGAVSYLPLITSVLVSLGGLALGYYAYRGFATVDTQDPAKQVTGSWYWNLLQNRYKIDPFYDWAFVRTSHWISEVFTYQWIDKKVIDGIIEGVAKGAWGLGGIIRKWIDLKVINWLGDHLGIGVRATGSEMRQVQNGRIQQYMLLAVVLVAVVGAVFFVVLRFIG
jgi:NADH-quinone oxidoreductase subunit L